jgi:hypothetical protein
MKNRTFKAGRQKIILTLACVSMLFGILTTMPLTAAAQTQTFNYDGFRVVYSITNSWQNNQGINITLTNTGTAPIRN